MTDLANKDLQILGLHYNWQKADIIVKDGSKTWFGTIEHPLRYQQVFTMMNVKQAMPNVQQWCADLGCPVWVIDKLQNIADTYVERFR